MSELAHGAMLVGALGGTACIAAGRHALLEVAASVAMLGAMADMAITRLVPPLGWTMVLLGFGMALGSRLRIGRSAPGRGVPGLDRHRAVHRALAFIVGAWAFAAPAAADGAAHAHASGAAFVAAVVAMTGFGGWLVVAELQADGAMPRVRELRGRPRRPLRHAAEAASMTLMLAAMAVPGVLAALA